MQKLRLLKMLALTVLCSGGCAVVTTGSDYDPGTDYSGYKTFMWEVIDPQSTGEHQLDDNPFFDSRVRASVEEQMQAKGLTKQASGADLLLHYHMFIEHRDRINIDQLDRELDVARGYSIYDSSVDVDVSEFDEGTLMIDVADADKKTIIWRGWAKLDVTDVLDNRDDLDKRVREAIVKIINRYPAG